MRLCVVSFAMLALCAAVCIAQGSERDKVSDPGKASVRVYVDRTDDSVSIAVLPRAVAICLFTNSTDCKDDRVTWTLSSTLKDREYVVIEPKMSPETAAAREANAALARSECFPNKSVRLDNKNPEATLALPRADREEICSALPQAWFYGVKLCTASRDPEREDRCDKDSELDPGVIIDRGARI